MQDNAPAHRAKIVTNLLKQYKVKTLDWPPNSPDMNPIENLWAYLSRRVFAKGTYKNTEDLFEALQKEWLAIPPDTLANLYMSMEIRMDLVRSKRGFPTRY